MTTFKIGDAAVYPGKGVGLIMGKEERIIRGKAYHLYVLQLEKALIRVQIDGKTATSVRPVMSEEELKDVYTVLSDRETKSNQTTWNRRYREYVQNINSGEPLKIASVLRELELFNIRKPLSFGESKMHSKALELVVEEGAHTLLRPKLEDFRETLSNQEEQDVLNKTIDFIDVEIPNLKEKVQDTITKLFEDERKAAAAEAAEREKQRKSRKSSSSTAETTKEVDGE